MAVEHGVNDYLATLIAYGITGCALWIWTRKSRVRYIRWQWRRPHWIGLRLLALFALFHGLFVLVGVPTGPGFVGLALVLAIGATAGAFGWPVLIWIAIVAVMLHEWVFWFPSRRRLILRDPRPAIRTVSDRWVGVEGVASSDLRPSGNVRVGGVERPARSNVGFVNRGERVVIEAEEDFELRVRKMDP